MTLAPSTIDKLDLQIISRHQTEHIIFVKVGGGKIREDTLVQTVEKLDTKIILAPSTIDKLDSQTLFMHQIDHIIL